MRRDLLLAAGPGSKAVQQAAGHSADMPRGSLQQAIWHKISPLGPLAVQIESFFTPRTQSFSACRKRVKLAAGPGSKAVEALEGSWAFCWSTCPGAVFSRLLAPKLSLGAGAAETYTHCDCSKATLERVLQVLGATEFKG